MNKLRVFFSQKVARRAQVRIFSTFAKKGASDSLSALFHSKCAYCETHVERSGPAYEIDLHRPKRLGGDPDARDHYWWLAYHWENMLPACRACNNAKRDLFPIAGPRATPGDTGDALAQEKPLLLDPTRDEPAHFLKFDVNGHVRPSNRASLDGHDFDRAQTTINQLQLNRTDLVKARAAAIKDVLGVFDRIVESAPPSPALLKHVYNRLSGAALHAGACRSILSSRQHELPVSTPSAEATRTLEDIRALLVAWQDADQPRPRARAPRTASAHSLVPAPPASVRPAPTKATVTEVKLENFRLIENLQFHVPQERPADLKSPLSDLEQLMAQAGQLDSADAAPSRQASGISPSDTEEPKQRDCGWKMLLGENGSGKSSVLQAIALALMGEPFFREHATHYGLDRSLRHGAATGSILVRIAQHETPFEVKITRRGLTWTSSPQGAEIFIRGYGATRLLPGRAAAAHAAGPAPSRPPLRQVANLFDPHAPLIDAEDWLRRLDEDDFHHACLTLKDILGIAGADNLAFEDGERRTHRFGLRHGPHFTPLEHFSAGYQTVLALACDIMAGTGGTVGEMRSMPGIILIDEIGTNLHPRWRMDILARLEAAFPNMQFIASTHEPLCLRGLGAGEVAVVRRRGDEIEIDDTLPSPAGLRIDQLLTSEFFGLDTTIDPETERAFGVYYDLLSREADLNPEQKKICHELGTRLRRRSVLGNSRRDQFILDAVDRYFAESRRAAAQRRPLPLPDDVRTLIRRALSDIQLPEVAS